MGTGYPKALFTNTPRSQSHRWFPSDDAACPAEDLCAACIKSYQIRCQPHAGFDFLVSLNFWRKLFQRPDIPIESIENLRTHWDFSKVKAKLVPSIAGKHEGWPNVLLSGHVRLMKAVRDMGLRTGKGKGKNVNLEYQVYSLLLHLWFLSFDIDIGA